MAAEPDAGGRELMAEGVSRLVISSCQSNASPLSSVDISLRGAANARAMPRHAICNYAVIEENMHRGTINEDPPS